MGESGRRWYKDAVFYQVWTRSFRDGDGDGIGDLQGVYEKLDYIASLGATAIWFNPLYPSPNADYGYDVSDYRSINPEFGDLELFQKVLDGAHERGMKVMMDLVINHTSIEHPWFKAAREDANSPYHDYYFWRKGKAPDVPPNNWDSLFCGRAWDYEPAIDEWYLHLFCREQADLNMDNPAVREEIKGIMRFWLDKGVDGFREDVVTYISKDQALSDDLLPGSPKGIRYYNRGPRLREFLAEFRHDVLDFHDCATVGESPMITPRLAHSFIAEGPDQLLDMIFHFQHMEADCSFDEYDVHPFELKRLKRAFAEWQMGLDEDAWDALFMENHDRPRIISHYGSEEYRRESGKMLAVAYLFQRGTPFIYQGQELGMTNIAPTSIDGYKDVMTKNNYIELCEEKGPETALALAHHSSRDSARTPFQWSAEPNAGFSSAEPWFAVNPNYIEVNAAQQEGDPDSVLNFYRAAVRLRRELGVVRDGSYREYYPESEDLYVYERALDGERLLVICSFTANPVKFEAPDGYRLYGIAPRLCNYSTAPLEFNAFITRPYETRVYLVRD